MSVYRYATGTRFEVIEDLVHKMADTGRHVIAVEVFDHPDARRSVAPDNPGDVIGPWLIGDAADVYDTLTTGGHSDYAKQYEINLIKGEENER